MKVLETIHQTSVHDKLTYVLHDLVHMDQGFLENNEAL